MVCFVFQLLSLMVCISEDLRQLSVCFKAFICQQNKDVVLKTTCCNIRIDMRGKVWYSQSIKIRMWGWESLELYGKDLVETMK